MTTIPVATDDLVQGATKYLLAIPAVTAQLGVTPAGTPYLFQHNLFVTMEGTSSTAAVLGYGGSWTGSNAHNTMRFPRLSLELYCDPLRDSGQNVTEPGETWRRLNKTFTVLDRYLHRVGGGEQYWGSIRTLSSVRQSDPTIYAVPDGNGLLRAQVFYAIEMG